MKTLVKDLHNALEKVTLNMESRELSVEELDDAVELALLMVDGLNIIKKRRLEKHE